MNPDETPDGTATDALVEDISTEDQVFMHLAQFKVISNPILLWLVANLPFILLLFLLIDWLLGWNTFAGDPLRLPAILVVIVDLFIMRVLFSRVPEAYRSIWAQGLIRAAKDSVSVEVSMARFLHQFEDTLNSRWSWLAGLFFAFGTFLVTLGGLALLGVYQGPSTASQLIFYFFFTRLGFIGPLLGLIIGLLVWRVAIIALYIHRFGKKYELNLIIGHPDKSGGLKPLGDLCLLIAFLLLVPAIYLSFWGIVITNYQIEGTEFYARVWSDVFRKLLILLSGSAFILFLQPLYSVHLQMKKREKELRGELERLSKKIGKLTSEIWAHAETGEPAQGIEKMKSLEFMEDVYQKNRRIPTWPLDWGSIWKFVGGQAVPLLTLIGTSDPLISSVQALISSFSP
jgi:hypothetical protein